MLRLIQQHTGTSQARLATATRIGQGRLNEIVNGRRQVTRLDVLERLADGLAMPDDARVLFGLAPVHADTLTGHAEIATVFTVQAEANRELREHAAVAARVDILAVRALGLIALNDSLLRGRAVTSTDAACWVKANITLLTRTSARLYAGANAQNRQLWHQVAFRP